MAGHDGVARVVTSEVWSVNLARESPTLLTISTEIMELEANYRQIQKLVVVCNKGSCGEALWRVRYFLRNLGSTIVDGEKDQQIYWYGIG